MHEAALRCFALPHAARGKQYVNMIIFLQGAARLSCIGAGSSAGCSGCIPFHFIAGLSVRAFR